MRIRVLFALIPLAAFAQAPASKSGVDTTAMNKAVDPCVDFHQYACGAWIKAHPLPADRSRYGRFAELQDRNEAIELDILKSAGAAKAAPGSPEQKIGDFFASCLDRATIDKKGLAPVKGELDLIYAMQSGDDLTAEVARLHQIGVSAFFGFGSRPDPKDSNHTIAGLSQGGLALPDRDYYLRDDAKSGEIRQRYVAHVANMFKLAGDSAGDAAAKAKLTMELETALAKAAMDRVSMRDPNKTYHMMAVKELVALAPGFDWQGYFKATGAPAFTTLNVAQPDTIKQLDQTLPQLGMEAFKAYFAYHLLRDAASDLPAAFEDEAFDFWQRYLAGVQQPRPREVRCAAATDAALGDLLGKKFIDRAFGADAKKRITQLVNDLEKAMGKDINGLAWMTPETKKAAQLKLKAITNNVGYPKTWRDYSKVTIARDDYLGNGLRTVRALYARRIEKIGKPTDKTEWGMTTPTVNAFYQPTNNSINFPAGILQLPFFDAKRDMAVNFGGAGSVIGHEMTHGFDDSGRKYDADGNLRDWWTAQDGAEFEKRAACLVDEYGAFSPVEGSKINGKLTLGENTADNGGLRVAYMGLQEALKGKGKAIDGFTPEQRLFLGFAQVWCENVSPQEARNRAMTDPHSAGHFRVNGTVQNMPEFQKAFSCKAGQPMVSSNACRVW
jgi:putative endopeptidase